VGSTPTFGTNPPILPRSQIDKIGVVTFSRRDGISQEMKRDFFHTLAPGETGMTPAS
jgi:hypothetical protein